MPGEETCFFESIGKILAERNPGHSSCGPGPYRHAAVLIPLFELDGECRVLLTKRTDTVEHHKGQISFPGGAVDESDCDHQETALRETHEEIGLEREEVLVLGRFDDTPTVSSNFMIHPYVGLIPYPYQFVLSPAEVERLVTVPLRIFHPDETAARRTHYEYRGRSVTSPIFTFDGEVIWGATARIMEMFMSLLADKIPLPHEKK